MLRMTFLRMLILVGVAACFTSAARAQAPWEKLRLFQRVDADPNGMYPLSDVEGPWMIMAVTFAGDTAEDEARELVYELRSRHKLHAYTHKVHFDFDAADPQKPSQQADRYGGSRAAKHRVDEISEVAVLVGNYPNATHPDAKKTLEQLKYLEPECLDLRRLQEQNRSTSRPLAALRTMQQALLPDGSAMKNKGPMGHAFITTNPLLPRDYFVPKGLEPMVVEMNRRVPHSLLDCPGRYTVKVATFTGRVILDQKKIKELEKEDAGMGSQLALAAEKAHNLTEALRAKNYDAYEFHDRTSSIVCVGSFDSVGTPRADGKIEIDPRIHAIMETFGAPKTAVPGQATPGVGQPKSLVGIPFDIQPLPVEVPRESISASLSKPCLSQR